MFGFPLYIQNQQTNKKTEYKSYFLLFFFQF